MIQETEERRWERLVWPTTHGWLLELLVMVVINTVIIDIDGWLSGWTGHGKRGGGGGNWLGAIEEVEP